MISNRQCLVLESSSTVFAKVNKNYIFWPTASYEDQLCTWMTMAHVIFSFCFFARHCISVTCDAALSWDVVFYSEQRSFSQASSFPTETVKCAWISRVQNKKPNGLHKIARKLAESKSVHWGRFLTAFMLATIGVKLLESQRNISQMNSTLLLNVPGLCWTHHWFVTLGRPQGRARMSSYRASPLQHY